MRLDFAFLADAADSPPGGKLYILGAGFDTIHSRNFPCIHSQISLVMRIILNPVEVEKPHKAAVQLIDADGKDIISKIEVNIVAPHPGSTPVREVGLGIVNNLKDIKFERPGQYSFEILLDGVNVKSLSLSLVRIGD